MAEIAWTLEALDDLDAIGAFHERTSPSYAAALVERLYEAVVVLEEHPHLGRKVPEIDHDLVRELIHRGYRIMYVVDQEGKEVEELTVLHSSRQFGSLDFEGDE